MSRKAVVLHWEENRVQVIIEGKLAMDLHWQDADRFWMAVRSIARKAEEYEKREQVVFDGAALFRAGVPIGLTDNPVLKKQVAHEGQYNDTLRRHLPGGVKSKGVVGTPAVKKHPPPKKGD